MTDIVLTLKEVRRLAYDSLLANGCDQANAEATADNITMAERDGYQSHGLFRLPSFVVSLKNGKLNGKAVPKIDTLAPGVIRVNGDNGIAALAQQRSRKALINRAREQGVAIAALTDIFHMAALWPDVEPLAEQGLCAIAMTASRRFVAPAGGSKSLFGTNPLAFAWPRKDAPPMVFDQAVSVMARGEVQIAARDGHVLPEGVGLDSDGNPSTDPQAVLEGVLLPFGGYKGSSIALMIEMLVAGLIGQPFSPEISAASNGDGGPERGGQIIIALDPDRFGDKEGWREHCETFFAEMLSQDGVRLPGDRRHARREAALVEGVRIPESLHRDILELSGA
ncbi:MAG: Ldh family oxidoreductase [Rhodospirillaceae bacterium]|nr:Ldh family oxidoreductase [Rhodospirillaceae bacterium]